MNDKVSYSRQSALASREQERRFLVTILPSGFQFLDARPFQKTPKPSLRLLVSSCLRQSCGCPEKVPGHWGLVLLGHGRARLRHFAFRDEVHLSSRRLCPCKPHVAAVPAMRELQEDSRNPGGCTHRIPRKAELRMSPPLGGKGARWGWRCGFRDLALP